ncbi:MAG: discoidin domain-containing protein [Clostridiales bacterium]|nr:discoidin domain-containing protein [Clostridiales bacterium]
MRRKDMKKKGTWMRASAGALSAAMVLGSVTVAPAVKAENVEEKAGYEVNYALNSKVTASNQEVANQWGPEKAVDGIVNRDAAKPEQSRWSTEQSTTQEARTLTLDLGTVKTFSQFVIEWERTNITNFKISVSDTENGEYKDVYVKEDGKNITSLTSRISLEEAATGRFVRLTVNGYTLNPGNWQSVSLYEFKVLGEAENLSKGAIVKADGHETDDFTEAKAIDGDDTTRWASPVALGEHWISLDYGKEISIQSFKIHWERTNATKYRLEKSSDGTNWESVVSFEKKPDSYQQIINLDEPINTQHVRLFIEEFDPKGAPENGNEVTWDTVGIYEFETYAGKLEEPENTRDPQEIADNLEIPELIEGDSKKFTMPKVPEEFEISFVGADYEQILDRDLTVYQPLVTQQIKMNFNVKAAGKDGKAVDSKEYTMTVTGKYEQEEGDNAKPAVIPELAEWKGAKGGEFAVKDGSRIVVANKDKAALQRAATEFQKDYKDILGKDLQIVYADSANAGDFFFTLVEAGTGLKEEGYNLKIDDSVTVEAETSTGAYWATRSILQILKQTDGTIAKGEARDYPKYEVRGFMLDVARRPFSKKIVDEVAKTMSWYKMNDLQLHLNDNYIFLEEYTKAGEDPMTAYEGFRLESNIKADGNLNKVDLTSDDIYWTKDEMRSMIQDYREIGMNVVPEFDTPAHSLSFTKVRPDLRFGTSGRENDHFNLHDKYSDSLEFVTGLWDEYLKGDNPVFDQGTTVNVGTDEYDGRYAEQFRQFTDDLLAHVQENGNQVRLWGSLSMRKGNTPVRSEDVQMNIWNDGWANPKEMYKEGYDLIDMNDGTVYIVPAAGYYGDYLSKQHLYNNYDPATRMGVPVGSEQTLGGAYAIWNDMVDKKANGLTEMEIYDRFNDAAPFYASSLWGDEEKTYEEAAAINEEIGEAPRTNAYDKVDSKGDTIVSYDFDEGLNDESGNGYDAKDAVNAKVEDKAFVLNGKESYVSTPLDRVGPGKELSFDITMKKPGMPGEILFEADAEYGTYDIRIMEDGTLGFTREGYDYSFGYKLPVNQKVSLTIRTDGDVTSLIADGKKYSATGSYTYEGDLKASNISRASLSLPTERIGSKTNAVNAVIDNIVLTSDVKKEDLTEGAIDDAHFTAISDNENSDGKIQNAFDDDPSTIWHTQWNPSKKELPATITIDMKKDYDINGFYYMPRQNGNNGYITKYTLYYEDESGNWQELVKDGTWASNGSEKRVMFKPVNTSKLKLVVTEGQNGFGSAAEFKVLGGTEDLTQQPLRISTYIEGNGTASVSKNEIIKGEEVTFTAETKNGSTFVGWYDVLGNEVSKEASYKVIPEDNLTLIAKFEGGEKPVDPENPVDKSALEKYYNECVAYYKENDYTVDSWKVYEAALANAKAVLDDKDATVEEIKEATEKLAKAAKDLVKKEENKKPETPSTDGSDESGKKPVTGDSAATPMMMVLAAAASVIAGKEILKRKREKREVDRE